MWENGNIGQFWKGTEEQWPSPPLPPLGDPQLWDMSFRIEEAKNNINLLLTEREGRTGEYWTEVVAVRTEGSKVCTN